MGQGSEGFSFLPRHHETAFAVLQPSERNVPLLFQQWTEREKRSFLESRERTKSGQQTQKI